MTVTAAQPGRPTIYLVDDDASMLLATSRLLRASGFNVKSFHSPFEFLETGVSDGPGCIILDLEMPGMSGLKLQEELRKAGVWFPIIFLTGKGDIPTAVKAIREGAEDFLTKRAPKEQLLGAIQRAIARYMEERARREYLAEIQARFNRLTPREREVFEHMLQGKLNKQVAAELGVDVRSVKRYRTSLKAKLQAESVAEMVRLANALGWPVSASAQ
jgi:FixJ family two-component response regulator